MLCALWPALGRIKKGENNWILFNSLVFLLSGTQGPRGPLLLIRDAKRQCQGQDHLHLNPSLDLLHLIRDLRRGPDQEALRGGGSLFKLLLILHVFCLLCSSQHKLHKKISMYSCNMICSMLNLLRVVFIITTPSVPEKDVTKMNYR